MDHNVTMPKQCLVTRQAAVSHTRSHHSAYVICRNTLVIRRPGTIVSTFPQLSVSTIELVSLSLRFY
jgi:hypothetical protein